MSTDVEDALRDALNTHGRSVPAETDPWTRFRGQELRHRRQRRARRAGTAAAVLAVAALVQTNLVPLPGWTPTIGVGPAADSPLLTGPVRGSLAGDRAWLAGMRDQVQDMTDDEGTWRVAGRDRIRVVFAGDVPGRRLALLVVPVRLGLIESMQTVWYVGPDGARPGQMVEAGNESDRSPVITWMDGNDSGGVAVVVAPRGARVEVADGAHFGADGRATREWRTVAAPDGVAALALPGTGPSRLLTARVTLRGARLYQGPFMGGWDSNREAPPSPVSDAMVTAALRDTQGMPADREYVHGRMQDILLTNGLTADRVTFRVPWSGRVDGKPAVLVTVQPRGGGVLAYAFHGTPEDSTEAMRLLLPARDADRRPLAWRTRTGDDRHPANMVVVVAQRGITAELVANGRTIPVLLDTAGGGIAPLRADAAAEVVARDGTGRIVGRTPVPPWDAGEGQVPGESADTRVVP